MLINNLGALITAAALKTPFTRRLTLTHPAWYSSVIDFLYLSMRYTVPNNFIYKISSILFSLQEKAKVFYKVMDDK